MATRKCRNIYFPKYFMAVRNFTNIYIMKYFRTSVNINDMVGSRIHYSSLCHVPLLHKEKATDRLNVA